MLQEVLRIPHVPPDIGVVYINPVDRKDVLQTNENKGENREEGSAGSKCSAPTSSEIQYIAPKALLKRCS